MYNYTFAHSISLCLCFYLSYISSFLSFSLNPSLHPFIFWSRSFFFLAHSTLLFFFLFLQTVLDAEPRSSRVSLCWRWRNSGTSAASDVGPATWFSPESTSASEWVKGEKNIKRNTTSQSMSRSEKSYKLKTSSAVFVFDERSYTFSISSFSLERANTLAHYSSFNYIFYVTGMECHTVRQITTPSMG